MLNRIVTLSFLSATLAGCGGEPDAKPFSISFARYTRDFLESQSFEPGRLIQIKMYDNMQNELCSTKLISAILNGDHDEICHIDAKFGAKPVAEAAKELSDAVTIVLMPAERNQEQVILAGTYEHPEVAKRVYGYLADRYQYRMMTAMDQAYRDEQETFLQALDERRRQATELQTEQLRLMANGAPEAEIETVKRRLEMLNKQLEPPRQTTVALTVYQNPNAPAWLLEIYEMEIDSE